MDGAASGDSHGRGGYPSGAHSGAVTSNPNPGGLGTVVEGTPMTLGNFAAVYVAAQRTILIKTGQVGPLDLLSPQMRPLMIEHLARPKARLCLPYWPSH